MEDIVKSYVNVKLPEELSKEIDALVAERVLGYRSRGEFVAEATRRLLISVRAFIENQEVHKPK